jgi:N-terminal domain of molybdenum-binding protein
MRYDAAVMAELSVGDEHISAEDIQLLSAVSSHGSLHQATESLNRSYAHAQRRVVALEDAVGPLMERNRGGPGGGGSELTDSAVQLIRRFRLIEDTLRWVADGASTIIVGTIAARNGELATVETAAGDITAVVPSGSGPIDLHIRAEAVSLVADSEPREGTSSIMNRFDGEIVMINHGAQIDRVSIDIGLEVPLKAVVTSTSTNRLRLAEGDRTGVRFKATAVRGLPRDPEIPAADGQ